MVLREFDLDIVDGYETPNEDEIDTTKQNYVFYLNGFISKIDKGFFTIEHGEGGNLEEALHNAYCRVALKFVNKYNLDIDVIIAEDYKKIEEKCKKNKFGNIFYPLDDDRELYEKLMNNKNNEKS